MITRTINGLKKLWQGEQPLGRAFWVYFIMGWIGMVVLAALAHLVLFSIGLRPLGLPLLVAAYLIYPFFAAIGVWRSANAYELHGFYPFLAKGAVCVVLAPIVWNLMNGGLVAVAQFLVSR